jgi:uncharacterized protein with HEPN domain
MPRKHSAEKDDSIRIRHMLDAAREAIQFASGRSRQDLEDNRMLARALKDCIQEIGEAASQVSDETRARVPKLPWKKMVGMRHILVHAYYDLDLDAIWKVVDIELPILFKELESVVGETGRGS